MLSITNTMLSRMPNIFCLKVVASKNHLPIVGLSLALPKSTHGLAKSVLTASTMHGTTKPQSLAIGINYTY